MSKFESEAKNEKFEDYRENLAKELAETPKKEKKPKLEQERNTMDYKEAKGRHQEKRGLYHLGFTETLKNAEDPEEVTGWIKKEFEDYADRHATFLMGFGVEDIFEQITQFLAKKLKANLEGLNKLDAVKTHDDTTYNESDEDSSTGTLRLMGRIVLDYSYSEGGYGFSIDEWHDEELKESVSDLIRSLRQ